jgi:hypothetical protein
MGMRQAVTAREEDSNFQQTLGRERIPNFILERRVERVPVLSGRSSRHGDQG